MDNISICLITIKSEDDIKDRLEEIKKQTVLPHDFIFVSNPKGGVAENRNICLRKNKNDYIIFIDDDLYDYPLGWDCILIEKLKSDNNILMIAPRLFNMDGSIQNTVSKCPDVTTSYIKVDYLPGACFAYKKNDIFFNEKYKMWGVEDIEFELIMKQKNKSGYFLLCNEVKIKHKNEMKREKEFGLYNKELFKKTWGFLIE